MPADGVDECARPAQGNIDADTIRARDARADPGMGRARRPERLDHGSPVLQRMAQIAVRASWLATSIPTLNTLRSEWARGIREVHRAVGQRQPGSRTLGR